MKANYKGDDGRRRARMACESLVSFLSFASCLLLLISP